ncbi:cyclic nucleotide-binding domain-containing protein, partial [Deltaproteobacteria bacterium TL4]
MNAESKSQILKFLQETKYFSDLEPETLIQFADFAEYKRFEDGDTVLRQGQRSDCIYFIMSGYVSVHVNGEHICDLKKQGDIFGEMSVITGNAVSATIHAYDHLEVLTLSSQFLDDLNHHQFRELQYVFYRWFALILSEKLFLTSLKPKVYAERNQELEQEKTKLLVSLKKIEELWGEHQFLMEKIEKITENDLKDLAQSLRRVSENITSQEKKSLIQGMKTVDKVQEAWNSATKLSKFRKEVQRKKVLLAENNKKQQIITKMALGGTGIELDIVENLEAGYKILAEKHYDILCSNIELIELTAFAHQQYPKTQSVFMTSDDVQSYLPVLKRYPHISNIISRHEEDRTFTVKNILITIGKLINQELFGLEKYLSWGIEIQEKVVTDSTQRSELIDQMMDYFAQMGVRRPILNKSVMIAEELLINTFANYDAFRVTNFRQFATKLKDFFAILANSITAVPFFSVSI